MSSPLPVEPGVRLALSGAEHVIERVNLSPDSSIASVVLRAPGDNTISVVGLDWLVLHEDRRVIDVGPQVTAKQARRVTSLDLLDDSKRAVLDRRVAHMLEAETGYKSGSANDALPDEPRPEYDPLLVKKVTQRRLNKVADLAGTAEEMSLATLLRLRREYQQGGLAACVDGRDIRGLRGRYSVDVKVFEAIKAVYAENLDDSNLNVSAFVDLVKDRVERDHGRGVAPGTSTLRTVINEMYRPSELTGKAKHRRTAIKPGPDGFGFLKVTHLGEYVAFDAWDIDELLANTIFEDAIRGRLILGLDLFCLSPVSVRVTTVAESAEDYVICLREVFSPKVWDERWPERAKWAYVGLPENIVSDLIGTSAAAMPFVGLENVVNDHGSPFKSLIGRQAVEAMNANLVPARRFRPTDKAHVEGIFRAIKTMLVQYLLAYKGSDVSERGADVQSKVSITASEMENLIRLWIIRHYQNHEIRGKKPSWCPEGKFSPNGLYSIGLAQTGVPALAPSALRYEMLTSAFATVRNRGIDFHGLIYDGPALSPYRKVPSKIGGLAKGRYMIRYDKYDMNRIYVQNPAKPEEYATVWWVNADPDNHVPFSDAHAIALNKAAKDQKVSPYDKDTLRRILFDEVLADVAHRGNRRERNRADQQQRHAERATQVADNLPGAPKATTTTPKKASSQARAARHEAAVAPARPARAPRRSLLDLAKEKDS